MLVCPDCITQSLSLDDDLPRKNGCDSCPERMVVTSRVKHGEQPEKLATGYCFQAFLTYWSVLTVLHSH